MSSIGKIVLGKTIGTDKKSSNFRDGAFQNVNETPQLAKVVTLEK